MEAAVSTSSEISIVGELAERYRDAWKSQDLEAILALHTNDSVFQLHVPGGEQVEGREAFAAFLNQRPDLHFATERLHVGPGRWVNQSTLTATVAGSLKIDGEALRASGAAVEVTCVDVIEVRHGRVARKDTYLDGVSFIRQIGVPGWQAPASP